MSRYSVYAVQLDSEFKAARAKYTEAYDLLKNAEAYKQQAGEDEELLAEHHLRKATAAFDLVKAGAWEEFDSRRKPSGRILPAPWRRRTWQTRRRSTRTA